MNYLPSYSEYRDEVTSEEGVVEGQLPFFVFCDEIGVILTDWSDLAH
jgi:hypothetical protein